MATSGQVGNATHPGSEATYTPQAAPSRPSPPQSFSPPPPGTDIFMADGCSHRCQSHVDIVLILGATSDVLSCTPVCSIEQFPAAMTWLPTDGSTMAWDPVHFGTSSNKRFPGDCHAVEIQHGRVVLDTARECIASESYTFLCEVPMPIGAWHADGTIVPIRCADDSLVIIDRSKMHLARWLHNLILVGFGEITSCFSKTIGVTCSIKPARGSPARGLVGPPKAVLNVAGPIRDTKEWPWSWDPLGLIINKEESRRQKHRLVEANHGRINSYTILGALSLDRSRWANNTLRSLAFRYADIQKYMSVFLDLPVAGGLQMFFFAGYITIKVTGKVEAGNGSHSSISRPREDDSDADK